MHHAVRIAQSQGRLVGEPTRATIPRRGRGITSPLYSIPAPYILFFSLLFFFFSVSRRPNGSLFMTPVLKRCTLTVVVAHSG